jgi:hypothetical protein
VAESRTLSELSSDAVLSAKARVKGRTLDHPKYICAVYEDNQSLDISAFERSRSGIAPRGTLLCPAHAARRRRLSRGGPPIATINQLQQFERLSAALSAVGSFSVAARRNLAITPGNAQRSASSI